MTIKNADIYRIKRTIRLIKSLENEEEKQMRLDMVRAKIEKMIEDELAEQRKSRN